jgi:hypothetical protein
MINTMNKQAKQIVLSAEDSFYKYSTKRVRIFWNGKDQSLTFGTFYSASDAIKEINRNFNDGLFSVQIPDIGLIPYLTTNSLT